MSREKYTKLRSITASALIGPTIFSSSYVVETASPPLPSIIEPSSQPNEAAKVTTGEKILFWAGMIHTNSRDVSVSDKPPVEQKKAAVIQPEKKEGGAWTNIALLREAQAELKRTNGYKEGKDNYSIYGEWYQNNIVNGPKGLAWNQKIHEGNYKNAPWCDMFLAWTANKARVEKFAGQFAYTPWHAEWFKAQGAWVKTPKPGEIVFYDWQGGKNISGIDHAGVVESVDKNGTIHTIEANFHDRLQRMVRSQKLVVGYGDPSRVKG
jgi:hypothetical protein